MGGLFRKRGMMIRFLIIFIVLFISGCAYNSRNIFDIHGKEMNFSYGLIACKNVDRVLLLRETNMGKGEAKYNLKNVEQYMCKDICQNEDAKQPTDAPTNAVMPP